MMKASLVEVSLMRMILNSRGLNSRLFGSYKIVEIFPRTVERERELARIYYSP